MSARFLWVSIAALTAGLFLATAGWTQEDPASNEAQALAPGMGFSDEILDLENLNFSSGEVASFDTASGKLMLSVYLDTEGNPSSSQLALLINAETEITDGENDLSKDSIQQGADVDVEYDKQTNTATYIFVY